MEDGQEGGQKVFAGNRAGTQGEFPRNGNLLPSDFLSGLPVEGEDALGVVVEPLARLGQEDATAVPTKQGRAQRLAGLRRLTPAGAAVR